MSIYRSAIPLFALFCSSIPAQHARSGDLIPFAIPWDSASETVVHSGSRLEAPAGKHGFIRRDGGRFVDGAGNRFRVLGVNTCFAGNFPTHGEAEAVAARMAKFGINCVRFHHMDTARSPRGIWLDGVPDKQRLDPERLDRLDYFIAQLKKNGIYANLNLKVGRETVEADGVPRADRLPRHNKGPDHFHPRLIELQKQYARDLLLHRNPYTGNRYADDPAIGFVEINNESGLAFEWGNGAIDGLPAEYLDEFREDWNRFLAEKYGDTQSLREAWAPESAGTGEKLLDGLEGWNLQALEEAEASSNVVETGPDGKRALYAKVVKTGTEDWHVQWLRTGLSFKKGEYLETGIWMRADPPREVRVGIGMNHAPWSSLDDYHTAYVSEEWKRFSFAFSPNRDEENGRLAISGLADAAGGMWIAEPTMVRSGRAGLSGAESLEDGTVGIVPREGFNRRAKAVRMDWMWFLIHRETEYQREMHTFLRDELGVKSLIGGTQLFFGTLPAQRVHDFVDIHGYWLHPRFPGRSWDPENWYVDNRSIVNAEDHVLQRLMLSRVEGHPFTVSEYNHPAPNTYASEAIPLMAAYAAFQDWDAIYFFAYSHNGEYQDRSIDSFFDIAGHTPKMAALPAAANLFLRGDAKPAGQAVVRAMEPDEYAALLERANGRIHPSRAWNPDAAAVAPFIHQTMIRYGEGASADNPELPMSEFRMESGTGELVWNLRPEGKSCVLIKSENTKGLIGYTGEPEYDLGGGMTLSVGDTLQDWANILLTRMDSENGAERWLLTATGYAENKGMEWKNEEKSTVGRDWGEGPPLVETIPLKLWMGNVSGPEVYALDGDGRRDEKMEDAAELAASGAQINLMGRNPSIWYEIVVRPWNFEDR